jgi:hypothetical protein
MRLAVSKPAWDAAVLKLNRNLTLNPSGPESEIKKKIKIKRGTR